MIIQHNMSAMNAKRQMGISTGALNKNTEKLSSGYKINRAGDDAAGLSISEKMRAQIRGLDRASSNSQDGISLIQTAEGALNETHSILQRMRELAVQAASDTNTDTDKQKIQDEIDQLTQEVDRIANTTEFNTKKLLNGDQEGAKEAIKGSAEINGNFVNGNVGVTVKGDINTSLSDVIRLTVKGLGDSTVTNAQGKASDGTIRVNVETLFGMDSDDTDIVYESNSVPKGGQYKVDPELKTSGKTTVSTVKLQDGTSVEYYVTKDDGTTATSEISGINKADIQADGSVYIETENGGRYSVNLGNGVVTDLKTNSVAQDVFFNDADRTITLKSGATGTTSEQKLQINITVKDANGKTLTEGTEYNLGANKTSNTTVTMTDSKTTVSADGVVKPPKIETINTTATTSGSTAATKGDSLSFEFEGRKYEIKLNSDGEIDTIKAMSGSKEVLDANGIKPGAGIVLRSGATVNGEKTFSIELQKNPSISGSATASDTPSAVITITAKMSGSKSATTGDRFAAGATHNVTITTTTPRTADNETRDYGNSQKVNTKSDATNGYMDLKPDANGNISFTFGGATVTINDADKLKVGDTVTLKVTGNQEAAAVNDINKDGIKLQIGANASQEMQMRISSMKASALNIANAKGEALDVTKQSSASMAIEAYDMAIQKVSKERAKMGAIQNRLEHTIANLDTASENLQSAESRIRDTDMAKEMTQYSKNNILMQAGQSMLAQANQQTQGVLTLLR